MELEGTQMCQMIENKVFSCHSGQNESRDKTAIEVGKI